MIMWSWPLTPKPNQFIFVPKCTNDKSLVKNHQQIMESTHGRKHAKHTTSGVPFIGDGFLIIGLALISIWSRSDRRYYAAITCDQVQAWSRSLVANSHSAESELRSQSSAVQTRTHRATAGIWRPWSTAQCCMAQGGEDGRCHSVSSQLSVVQ